MTNNLKFEIVENYCMDSKVFEVWGQARLEILQNKHVDETFSNESPSSFGDALVAYSRNKVVGIICFYPTPDAHKSLWISTSYVLPKYRRKGIYYAMRVELTAYAKSNDYLAILGGVHSTNTSSLKAKLDYGDKIIFQTFKETIR